MSRSHNTMPCFISVGAIAKIILWLARWIIELCVNTIFFAVI
jgi:hypothetical protein